MLSVMTPVNVCLGGAANIRAAAAIAIAICFFIEFSRSFFRFEATVGCTWLP
jgi:hypothetical protein